MLPPFPSSFHAGSLRDRTLPRLTFGRAGGQEPQAFQEGGQVAICSVVHSGIRQEQPDKDEDVDDRRPDIGGTGGIGFLSCVWFLYHI